MRSLVPCTGNLCSAGAAHGSAGASTSGGGAALPVRLLAAGTGAIGPPFVRAGHLCLIRPVVILPHGLAQTDCAALRFSLLARTVPCAAWGLSLEDTGCMRGLCTLVQPFGLASFLSCWTAIWKCIVMNRFCGGVCLPNGQPTPIAFWILPLGHPLRSLRAI